jgi:hypothetical protein
VPVPPQTQLKVQTATTPAETASATQSTTASGSSLGAKEEKSAARDTTTAPPNTKPTLSKNQASQIPPDRRGASAKKEPVPIAA